MVAGAFLAVGSAISALTKNQVIAFVLAVAACFFLTAAGTPVVTEFLSQRIPQLADIARAISVTDRLGGFSRGIIAARDVIFFASFIGFFLFANTVAVDQRKAD
jgi:ABC-2 type transport system permease protein